MGVRGFVRGARYRHQNCLDIDLEVIKVGYRGPNYTKMRVIYLNRNWQGGNFVIDPRSESITVYKKDYWLWQRIK